MAAIDNAEKVGWKVTADKLLAIVANANVPALLNILRTEDALGALEGVALDELGLQGVEELRFVEKAAREIAGLLAGDATLKIDLTIARGLDYYTGTVVETRLHEAPELGSVCSGGRYENLTASLGKKVLPGVGLSIGLSRLLSWLLTQGEYAQLGATPARVLVACQDEGLRGYYSEISRRLRGAGLAVEQHTGAQALGTQLKNAAKRGIDWAVLANAEDAAALRVQVKNLATGEQDAVDLKDILHYFEKCTKN
jgi:histidyl-tRNA synthetase